MSCLDSETRLAIMAIEGYPHAFEHRVRPVRRTEVVSTVLALASLALAIAMTITI